MECRTSTHAKKTTKVKELNTIQRPPSRALYSSYCPRHKVPRAMLGRDDDGALPSSPGNTTPSLSPPRPISPGNTTPAARSPARRSRCSRPRDADRVTLSELQHGIDRMRAAAEGKD